MASATVESAAAATEGGLIRLDSIPIVDLRLLSQSELYSLSRCSSPASDSNHRDDVVVPIIDRSVFNESAGSRKQTYSRLAPSDSSSSAALRSRTPHLRSTGTASYAINSQSNPENAEDYQIINLLKQLFVADMDPGDLFPVKIEYSNSLPTQQFTSPPPLSTSSNVCPTGIKRKRGRPRKNEYLGNVEELAVEVSVVDASDVEMLPIQSLNEIVVRDDVEERDREVLNSDGVAVDLAALGAVEHPFMEEIRRRTEGLLTEEELMGFLQRLNGKWASRRKKKRIVDAGEFGSKLPVGWKLLLSVKKKNGHVWLYCRRYISPGGLHFVSCKGVSSYLLSLHGVHNTYAHSSAHYDDIVNDADNLIPVTLAVQDGDEIGNFVSCAPSPSLNSSTGNNDIQVVVNVGNLPEDRIGESLCCNQCNVTFSHKEDFLLHQSSLHRKNRNKNVVRITDGVIIKDGRYECQFCHKTFSERHRYNGHVGTHVRFQPKTTGESLQPVHPISLNGFATPDIAMEGSSISHNDMEVCNSITDNSPTIHSLLRKNDEHFGVLEEASGNLRGTSKAADIVTETNPCSAAECPFSSNKNRSYNEDACPNSSAAEISDHNSNLEGRRLESFLSHNDTADSDMNDNLIENSASLKKPKQIMLSKSGLLDCNDHFEESLQVNNNQHNNDDSCNQTRIELKLDSQTLPVNGSVFDIFGTQGDQENLAVSIKEKRHLEYMPCKDIGTTYISTSRSEASKLDDDPTISLQQITDDKKACREHNAPYSLVKGKVDETLNFGRCENESSKADNDGADRHEEMQFEIASVIQSWNEQENVSKKGDTEVFIHLLETPGVQDMSKTQLIADDECMYQCGSNDEGACRRETKKSEFDCLQNLENGQSNDLFSSSCARLRPNSITETEQDTGLECSPFTSATDKQLSVEDNMTTIFNDAMEEGRQVPSEGLLLDQYGVSDVSKEAYNSTKIYNTPVNVSELNGVDNAGKHELSLSFGSLRTDMCTESNNRVEQESYQTNSFNIDSAVHKTYADSTHSSIQSSNLAANLERDRPFGYPNLSFNDRTHEPGSGFNVAHPERDWDGNGESNIRASGQNFMIGFGNSSLQTSECVAAEGTWKDLQDNVYGGCFNSSSGPHIPSSSYFPTFGLAPNKDQESSFGFNNNYGIRSDMMRPCRTQPVEYSFMGDQRANSLSGEPKVFSYGTNMEQGMDSSFWLGKDALTANTSHASQATSVCVWCRSVFFHEPGQAGMEAGAIGTICPSCSSKVPGQFNLL